MDRAPHVLIVGDIHGCREELEMLLRAAHFGAGDALLLLGDLVAKGPDSQGVVQLARERGARAVLGNHDAKLLQVRSDGSGRSHQLIAGQMHREDWEYLESLPLTISLDAFKVLAVHAGLLPGVALEAQESKWLLNLRSMDSRGNPSARATEGEPWAKFWNGPEFVTFGHDALRGLQLHPHAIGLDTGCVYGRTLTGWWLPERRFVSVQAKRAWVPIEGRKAPDLD